MPDLPSFLSSAKVVTTIASAIVGGVVVRLYNLYLRSDQQTHQQDMDLSSHLSQRLDKVESRLDLAETKLSEAQQELASSRVREINLQAAVDTLIERIDMLIHRLGAYEDVSEAEREELKSLPYLDE